MTAPNADQPFELQAALDAEAARRDRLGATLAEIKAQIGRAEQERDQALQRRRAAIAACDEADNPPTGQLTGADIGAWLDHVKALAEIADSATEALKAAEKEVDRLRARSAAIADDLARCEGKIKALEKLRRKHQEAQQQRLEQAEDSERDDNAVANWARRQSARRGNKP